MKTLTQLLRLRQTCCDPRLLDKTLEAESSAKRAGFLELLEEAIDGGHRILVFSQFVSILSLLKVELEQQSIDYCYIDGSTRNRMAQVDRFQDRPWKGPTLGSEVPVAPGSSSGQEPRSEKRTRRSEPSRHPDDAEERRRSV